MNKFFINKIKLKIITLNVLRSDSLLELCQYFLYTLHTHNIWNHPILVDYCFYNSLSLNPSLINNIKTNSHRVDFISIIYLKSIVTYFYVLNVFISCCIAIKLFKVKFYVIMNKFTFIFVFYILKRVVK